MPAICERPEVQGAALGIRKAIRRAILLFICGMLFLIAGFLGTIHVLAVPGIVYPFIGLGGAICMVFAVCSMLAPPEDA